MTGPERWSCGFCARFPEPLIVGVRSDGRRGCPACAGDLAVGGRRGICLSVGCGAVWEMSGGDRERYWLLFGQGCDHDPRARVRTADGTRALVILHGEAAAFPAGLPVVLDGERVARLTFRDGLGWVVVGEYRPLARVMDQAHPWSGFANIGEARSAMVAELEAGGGAP